MTAILGFYEGSSPDDRGRYLSEIQGWPDAKLESVHDFIQWLFPLPEPSQFNPDAPLLSSEDIAAFRAEASLRANLRRSFERILSFLGLTERADASIGEGASFAARAADVWTTPNHNWLRITRILRSLTLLGLETEAHALYACLNGLYQSRRFPIPDNTFRYWSAAVKIGNPA